jgi:multicomponent Na+:H+ antiporter subunit A
MRRSLIVEVIARVVFHSALVLALYLLFAGHNQPGGGFVGGLVAGAAYALLYGAGGVDAVRHSSRVRPWTLLGIGLMFIAAAALVPLVLGESLLESAKITFELGPLGSPKASTAIVFDTGVFLVVVGMVLMLFEAFGEHRQPVRATGSRPEVFVQRVLPDQISVSRRRDATGEAGTP